MLLEVAISEEAHIFTMLRPFLQALVTELTEELRWKQQSDMFQLYLSKTARLFCTSVKERSLIKAHF